MNEKTILNEDHSGDGRAAGPMFGHPDEILATSCMSRDEKRALLASLASDARAVRDAPSLRHLDDGSLVEVSAILRAMKALDEANGDQRSTNLTGRLSLRAFGSRRPSASRIWSSLARRRTRNDEDDDDDPPPCPAIAANPPRHGSGGAAALLVPA